MEVVTLLVRNTVPSGRNNTSLKLWSGWRGFNVRAVMYLHVLKLYTLATLITCMSLCLSFLIIFCMETNNIIFIQKIHGQLSCGCDINC